jgi:hypothetical protein
MNKLIFSLIVLVIAGCHVSPTGEESKDEILFPPNKNLSVAEILHEQKIKSLHFYQWDSMWTENHFSVYFLNWEVYLDSKHIRTVEYSYDSQPAMITVFDLEKWNLWQYSPIYNKYYPNYAPPDTFLAFEATVKRYITTQFSYKGISEGFEDINNYRCHLTRDSLNNKEWIWVQHGLPIKYSMTYYPEGISIQHRKELKNIEIDAVFSDSIFIKP